jgi:hypothetical protein
MSDTTTTEGLRKDAELQTLRTEVERLRVQLAGCATAAQGWIDDPAKPGDYGWSPAYQDVLSLRLRVRAMERVVRCGQQAVSWWRANASNTDGMFSLAEALADYERVVKEKP